MDILIETIRQIASSECKRIMKECNVGHNVYGTITEVGSGNNYSVLVAGGSQVYTNIKNKSNSSLSVGDAVVIEAINGNLGNGFIIAKMGA